MNRFSFPALFRLSPAAWIVLVSVVALFALSATARVWVDQKMREMSAARVDQEEAKPERLIALAPSNVESLFALGLGDKVVGVSRYTKHPPEATKLPRVSGLVDVDYEQMLLLKPDCVVMLESQKSLVPKFHELGLKTLMVDHSSVEGIISGFVQVSEVCGRKEKAKEIAREMRSHIGQVKSKVEGRERPRVLVCIHHSTDVSEPETMVIAGNAGYHQELIDITGGVNAYEGPVAFPKISRENLINLDPDIIIDLINDKVADGRTAEELERLWSFYGELKAVKNGKVKVVAGDQHFMPGPRLLDTVDVFASIIQNVRVPRKGRNMGNRGREVAK